MGTAAVDRDAAEARPGAASPGGEATERPGAGSGAEPS
jgi:hypothetical protein